MLQLRPFAHRITNRISRRALSTETSDGVNDEGASPADVARANRLKQKEAEEARGVFRVLDIGLPKSYNLDRETRFKRKEFRVQERKPSDVDWGSSWPAPKTFHPHIVPLPLRQGYVKKKSGAPIPDKHANVELMKIPNFLHATPPAIRQHCEAIKKFCTEWPKELNTEEVIDRTFPLRKETCDYLNASSSLRDFRARIVTFRFKISNLFLGKRGRDKIIRLLGPERYDLEKDEVVIAVDRCPFRKQNSDYFNYLITALYFESSKVEDWEKSGGYSDTVKFEYDGLFQEGDKESDRVTDADVKKVYEHLINEGENANNLAMYKDAILKKHYEFAPF